MLHLHRRRQKIRRPEHVVPIEVRVRQEARGQVREVAADEQQHHRQRGDAARAQRPDERETGQGGQAEKRRPGEAVVHRQHRDRREAMDHPEDQMRVIGGVETVAQQYDAIGGTVCAASEASAA